MLNLNSTPPLSLYIHTPWCVKKCPYCDFNSHEIKSELPEDAYLQALLNDLEQDLPRIWGRRVTSVFIGGGTPSALSPEFYNQLFSDLRARLMLNVNAEITMEANPGTIDSSYFKAYREAGINRLSIGIQSFNDQHLKLLGRIHDGDQAKRAVSIAREAGFDNLNLDLMFGLPSQTIQDAHEDIVQAMQFEPEHFSYYQLTIEPNTFFYSHKPSLPDDDPICDMQARSMEMFVEHGFEQYEISAYSKSKRQCIHNRNYWEFGDYLGIGAGAHSKLTDVNQKTIVRFVKEKHPREYIKNVSQAARIISTQKLTAKDLSIEFMMNALRLTKGFSTSLFSERTGLPISVLEQSLLGAEKEKFIKWDVNKITPTEKGKLFLNNLLEFFVPEKS